MKKIKIILLELLLIAGIGFTAEKNTVISSERAFALAKVPPASDFKYELTDDLEGIRITAYRGYDVHIRIPDMIEGMPVVELAGNLFRDTGKRLETVIIPDTIKTVGKGLFGGCKALKNVRLSSALTSIPEDMFGGCESLESFTIPAHISNIESGAFSGSGLRTIYIPDTITSFSTDFFGEKSDSLYIFSYCKKLESVRLPPSMTTIYASMFSNCIALRSITLHTGITKIGVGAFENCKALTDLKIPDTVTVIQKEAFDGVCLKSLIIPDSVTTFECTFGKCKNLEYLRLPNSLTEISNELFHADNTENSDILPLKSVNLPTALERLGYGAFRRLSALQELIIPDSIVSLEFDSDWEYNVSFAFSGTALPIATQKRLKQLGYPGKF